MNPGGAGPLAPPAKLEISRSLHDVQSTQPCSRSIARVTQHPVIPACARRCLPYLSLFTSLATVFCCALPAFLVLIGLSFTSVLAFFTAIPGWQKFGQHENWYYLLSGTLLALGFYFAYFRRSAAAEVCEIPAGGSVSACSTATRWNRRTLWFSLFLYSLAVVMNFWGIGWMRTYGTSVTKMMTQPRCKQTARLLCLGLLVSATLFCPEAKAQSIIAPAGRTLFNRESVVRSFTEIDRFSLGSDGNSVEGTEYINPLAIVYGFRPKWQAIAVLPYVVTDITTRITGQVQEQGMNGLADTQFFVQYDGLYRKNAPGGLTRLSGIFGVQAPTGAKRFSTGAFEYTGGLIFEKAVRLKYYLTSDFEYTFATRNNQGVSTGDSAQFDVVPAYMLIARGDPPTNARWARKAYNRIFRNGTFLILEFNGTWHANSTLHGTNIANTGGTMFRISPGIQYFPSRSFLVEFSAPLPAITEVNGVQPNPRTTFLVGFRYLF